MSLNPIEEKLTIARIGLMLRAAFFGNLASRMKLIDASDWCSTAATDGRNFFYNSEFIESLTVKQIEFLFGHEILHCALDHFGRCGSRNRKLANIAQDFAVNQILIDEQIGQRITQVQICQNDKYRGWAWEEIYDELYDKAEKIDMSQLLKELGDQLDDHINEDSEHGAGGEDGNANGVDGNGPPMLSKEEMRNIRDEIKEAMMQAAAAAAGKVPAAIQRLLKDLSEPKMNWREIVQMNIQSIARSNYSFSRPSRKGWASGAVLPGMVPEQTIDIAIALDMSGSIADTDAIVFLSEVKGIVDQYTDFSIDLWTFDTKVYNHQRITHDNIDDLINYDLKGGGGTDFTVNFDFMKDIGMQPKKFFMFTDGMPCGSWGDSDFCDTVFLIKDNQGALAPFGETLHYERIT